MSAWQIPLSVDQPKFETPIQAATQAMNLKQLAQSNQVRNQQIQENALKIQAAQEDQEDQKTIQGAVHGALAPDGTIDFDKVLAQASPKIRLRNLEGLQKWHSDVLSGTLKMDADKRAKLLAHNTMVGNELMGIMQAPEDQQAASYAGSRARLIQQGDIDPNDPEYPEQYPGPDAIKSHAVKVGLAASIQKLATDKAEEERKKDVAARAKAQAAKEDAITAGRLSQQNIEDAARDHLKVTDQASHDEWLAGLDEDTAKRMPKKFDPATTPQVVQNMALTAEQRSQNIDRDIRAKADAARSVVAGGKAGLAARAHDPTATDDEHKAAKDALEDLDKRELRTGFTTAQALAQANRDRAEMDRDRDKHDSLQEKEQEQWRLAEAYGPLADPFKTPNGTQVVDPKSPASQAISMSDARRDYYKSQYEAARKKATDFAQSQKQIRAQHQWGEFAPGKQAASQEQSAVAQPPAVQPGQVPATPAKQAAPAKPPQNGEIRTRGGIPYRYDASRAQWVLQQQPR